MRKYLAFALLGILTLVGGGFAVAGAVQSPGGTDLGQAVKNTLKAPNYTQDTTEQTPQGNQQVHLVYQSPDRLGGWLRSSGRKTYLFIIGSTEYIGVSRRASATVPTKFYTQRTTGALAVDPAHSDLPFWNCKPRPGSAKKPCPSVRNGPVTTVKFTQGGSTTTLTYTVTGDYVSKFTAAAMGASYELVISRVGTSPKVSLPKGFSVTTRVPSAG